MFVKIKDFEAYNHRRYSRPWVALLVDAKPDFSVEVGRYTAKSGDAGELLLVDPQVGQVFAYGQKDYKGRHTEIAYCVYTEKGLVEVPADKLSSVDEILAENSSQAAHREVEIDFTKAEEKESTAPTKSSQKRAQIRRENQNDSISQILKAIAEHDGTTEEALLGSMVIEDLENGKRIVDLDTPLGHRRLTIGRNCGLTAFGKKPKGSPKMMRNYQDVLDFGFVNGV